MDLGNLSEDDRFFLAQLLGMMSAIGIADEICLRRIGLNAELARDGKGLGHVVERAERRLRSGEVDHGDWSTVLDLISEIREADWASLDDKLEHPHGSTQERVGMILAMGSGWRRDVPGSHAKKILIGRLYLSSTSGD